MSQITDHVDACAAAYIDAATNSPGKYTKDFITTELDEWVQRLFTEGAIKDVHSGWIHGGNKYEIVFRPADAECMKITQHLLFPHLPDTSPTAMSDYERAMKGLG